MAELLFDYDGSRFPYAFGRITDMSRKRRKPEHRRQDDQPRPAPICPYCGATATLIDSAEIYGKSYGWSWKCPTCADVYVGCHRGSTVPLGTLANPSLRLARCRAHAAFDKIWKRVGSRDQAYAWLAEKLEIPSESCHIAMMDEQTCTKVCELMTPI